MKRSWIVSLAIAAASFAATPLAAGELSSRPFEHSQVALLGGSFRDGRWSAGVEIRMAPGWKTYWKVPGASGVPPHFDWIGSRNAAAIDLGWPAPGRYMDEAGEVIGYKDRVVFPVAIAPSAAGRPVNLRLELHYAVCNEICVPVSAELSLDLDREDAETGLFDGDIVHALSLVPKEDDGGVSIAALSVEPAAAGYDLLVELSGAGLGADADILVEGPERYFFRAPVAVRTAGDGGTWRLHVDGLRAADDLRGSNLTLTILSGETRLVRRASVQ